MEKQTENTPEADSDLLAATEVAPGIQLPKVLAAYWKEIEKTKMNYISIQAVASEDVSIEKSSFGYYPRLPENYSYPTDAEGKFMFPLAQINCSELPVLQGFPHFGYLQFYIATNDLFGIDFNNQQSQINFRVLYFEEDEVVNCQTDFSFLKNTMTGEYNPVYKPHALAFSIKEEYFGMQDIRSRQEGVFNLSKIADQYPAISDDIQEYVWDYFQSNGHKMGGYAYFTQDDPRNEEQKDYVLLLQIDSDDEIMWGDAGVANFFIHPDDLKKKDFSRVMYNWDCS